MIQPHGYRAFPTNLSSSQRSNVKLSINLIERSRIRKTRIPDLVHQLSRLEITLTERMRSNRQGCLSPHTFLMLLSDLPLTSSEEFLYETTFSTETSRSNLSHHPFNNPSHPVKKVERVRERERRRKHILPYKPYGADYTNPP